MTQNNFEELSDLVNEYKESHPQQRDGQALFNTLFVNFPEVAEAIRATSVDPFYKDDRIPECYEFIYSTFVKK